MRVLIGLGVLLISTVVVGHPYNGQIDGGSDALPDIDFGVSGSDPGYYSIPNFQLEAENTPECYTDVVSSLFILLSQAISSTVFLAEKKCL